METCDAWLSLYTPNIKFEFHLQSNNSIENQPLALILATFATQFRGIRYEANLDSFISNGLRTN